MLKVKGFSNGFLHPIAEIPCNKETVHVDLFSLGLYPGKGQFRFGSTRGILVRSVEGRLNSLSQINSSDKMIARDTGVEADERREAGVEAYERREPRSGLSVFSDKGNSQEYVDLIRPREVCSKYSKESLVCGGWANGITVQKEVEGSTAQVTVREFKRRSESSRNTTERLYDLGIRDTQDRTVTRTTSSQRPHSIMAKRSSPMQEEDDVAFFPEFRDLTRKKCQLY